jgi:hypothetical protein
VSAPTAFDGQFSADVNIAASGAVGAKLHTVAESA